jgi:hypothetical protein
MHTNIHTADFMCYVYTKTVMPKSNDDTGGKMIKVMVDLLHHVQSHHIA